MKKVVLSLLLGTVNGGDPDNPKGHPSQAPLSCLTGGGVGRGLCWQHKAGTRLPKAWEVLGFRSWKKTAFQGMEALSTNGLWGGRVTACGEADAVSGH